MHQGEYLKRAVNNSGLTVEEFAKQLNTVRSNMYQLYKKELLDEFYLDKIRHMGLDLDNLKPQRGVVREPKSKYDNEQDNPIPFYEANVTGGNVNNFGEQVKNASYFLTIPHFKDCSIAVRVNGHSMYPKYCNGDIVVCKKINEHTHIPYGEPHIVVLADYSVLKYIHPHPTDKTMYTLKSANEKFEPMEIKREDVLGVYLVRGKLELT